jgi:hypothetical protein
LSGASEAAGLLGIVRRLARARTQEEIMTVVSHGVRALLDADGATFVLRDGDRCYYAEEDAISPLWKGRRFPMKACVSGWCMQHRQPVAIADIYQDARVPPDAYRPTFVRSLAMAPVGADEPLAALGAYWSEVRQPTPEELERLKTIADAAALAVANVQLRQAERGGRGPPPARRASDRKRSPAPTLHSPGHIIDRLRMEGLRPSSPEAYAFAVVCVVIASLLRELFSLSEVRGLVIYSTYYPAAA